MMLGTVLPADPSARHVVLVLAVLLAAGVLHGALAVVLLWRRVAGVYRSLGLRRYPAMIRTRASCTRRPRFPVVVPPGEDGRPGQRLFSPARPSYPAPAVAARRGPTPDAALWLGHGGVLLVSCLGRAGRDAAAEGLRRVHSGGSGRVVEEPRAARVAGVAAVTYSLRLRRRVLTEWTFVKDGWVFCVGFVRPAGAPERTHRLAQHTLATWTWIEPDGVALAS